MSGAEPTGASTGTRASAPEASASSPAEASAAAAAWTPALIALGSNLGDRESLLRQAVADLDAVEGIRVVAASGLIETPALKPEGVDRSAPTYLNAVVRVATTLSPETLLDALHVIEQRHGRERLERWGDRTLDLDIVELGDIRIDSDRLTVPHPRAWQRAFVLAPWAQLEPDAVIPGRGRVADLLAATGESPVPYGAGALA